MSDHHEGFVDGWMDRCLGPDGRSAEVIDLYDCAFAAIWTRCRSRLDQVTLMAIADRVLHVARERFPDRSPCLRLEDGGFRLDALRGEANALETAECRAILRFVAVEFLRTLGRLTAEILTPSLHADLDQVGRAARDGRGTGIRRT